MTFAVAFVCGVVLPLLLSMVLLSMVLLSMELSSMVLLSMVLLSMVLLSMVLLSMVLEFQVLNVLEAQPMDPMGADGDADIKRGSALHIISMIVSSVFSKHNHYHKA